MANIKELILHRIPFLFVDKVQINDGQIEGSYTFQSDFFAFKGHFPDNPIVPGVLLIECMAQCGGAGYKLIAKESSSLFVLSSIEKASFHKKVLPNEKINMIIENLLINEKVINQRGRAFVDNKLVAKAEWICIQI